MTRIRTLETPINVLDPDGSLIKELQNRQDKIPLHKGASELRSAAEMLLLNHIAANKKEADKKYRDNQEFIQTIFLASLLECCRLYLAFLRITEQNLEKLIEREEMLDRQRYDEKMQALQSRIEDIYKTQHHPIEPQQQKLEKLLSEAIAELNDIQTRIDDVHARRQEKWGSNSWEEGLKKHAEAAMDVVRDLNPLDLVTVPKEVSEAAVKDVAAFHDELEQRLSERPSFEKLRKVLDTSYAEAEDKFFKPVVNANIPVAPPVTKIYAPTNKNIKDQFELDTEVLIAANARNLYQNTCGYFLQKKSFVNLGVEYAKEAMEPIRKLYHERIKDYMDDSIILENLQKLKDEVSTQVNHLKNSLHLPQLKI